MYLRCDQTLNTLLTYMELQLPLHFTSCISIQKKAIKFIIRLLHLNLSHFHSVEFSFFLSYRYFYSFFLLELFSIPNPTYIPLSHHGTFVFGLLLVLMVRAFRKKNLYLILLILWYIFRLCRSFVNVSTPQLILLLLPLVIM